MDLVAIGVVLGQKSHFHQIFEGTVVHIRIARLGVDGGVGHRQTFFGSDNQHLPVREERLVKNAIASLSQSSSVYFFFCGLILGFEGLLKALSCWAR